MKEKWLGIATLFTSMGTLICCALPALIAALAGGAAVAAMISVFPWLIPLSAHKGWIFLVAGALILINGLLVFRTKKQLACDHTNTSCQTASRFSQITLLVAMAIYLCGTFFAYALVPLLILLGGHS